MTLIQGAFFVFFLFSGFCGLLYEVVWTRLAMANFGVTTTVVSVVLSVFMAGLALGSWLAGNRRLLARIGSGRRFLRAYALVELGIGSGALLVPLAFELGRWLLLQIGQSDSGRYLVLSALFISLALLPFATLMGATYALALGALRAVAPAAADGRSGQRAFSFLYVANVLGAALGTILSAVVLIEIFGFHRTLRFGAAVNGLVCAGALWLSRTRRFTAAVTAASSEPAPPSSPAAAAAPTNDGDAIPLRGAPAMLVVLFATGAASMAMEVVWARMFSHYLGTFVYAFAGILTVYLVSTYVGAYVYRWRAANRLPTGGAYVWSVLGFFSVLPLLYADPRVAPHCEILAEVPWLIMTVAPICAALGYATPMLVDRYGARDVGRTSRAYSINVIGCIVGPPVAGYLLLPLLGERRALLFLAAGPLAVGVGAVVSLWRQRARTRYGATAALTANLALMLIFGTKLQTYVESIPGAIVERDYTATVVAAGTGMEKQLLVNGIGITNLTTITKMMAHFPLASLDRSPRSALVICFGMGTTFRSLAAWGIQTTGVDLVPSVPKLFGYFHADASRVLGAGNARVVIDDGRRFLDRTRETFDVITLDPPPPIQAAGCSMLYSRDLYRAAKRRLAPGGILATWTAESAPSLVAMVTRAIRAEFKYVRAFQSIEGWGIHYIASDRPLPRHTSADLADRLPAEARADIVEWAPDSAPADLFEAMLGAELDPKELSKAPIKERLLTDDRPANEYFALRKLRFGVP